MEALQGRIADMPPRVVEVLQIGDTAIRSMYTCEQTDVLKSMSNVSLRVANQTCEGHVHDGDIAQSMRTRLIQIVHVFGIKIIMYK